MEGHLIPLVRAMEGFVPGRYVARVDRTSACRLGGSAQGNFPFDWLGQLYQWIDAQLGQPRQSGLLTAAQDSQFENFKITDVGIHRNTLSQSYASLVRLNKQRTVPHSPEALWIKYLRQMTFPKLINDEALKQLQGPTYIIANGPHAGQPDLSGCVRYSCRGVVACDLRSRY